MTSTPIKNINKSIIFFIFHFLTRAFKISLAAGSTFFFPLSAAFWPLIGLYSGFQGIFITFSVTYFSQILSGSFFLITALHLPTVAGALYWSIIKSSHVSSKAKSLIITLISISCTLLFVAHPIGSQAAPYSLFWLIPVIMSIFGKDSIFFHALGSTFMCHAVGSVVWLYTKTALMPADWLSLMPIVCIERLLIALLMTGCYYGFSYLYSIFNSLFFSATLRPLSTQE